MPSERTDFLRDYYRVLAEDISRSETMIPKACGLEIAAAAFLLVTRMFHWQSLLPNVLTLLTTTWATHLLINANLWARRSQLMAANVEREFFTDSDMDMLLPRSFYSDARVFRYRRIFQSSILFSFLLFFIALAVLPVSDSKLPFLWALAALLLASLYFENRNCATEFEHLIANAPGRQFDVKK
jgi:hypothetical protein